MMRAYLERLAASPVSVGGLGGGLKHLFRSLQGCHCSLENLPFAWQVRENSRPSLTTSPAWEQLYEMSSPKRTVLIGGRKSR